MQWETLVNEVKGLKICLCEKDLEEDDKTIETYVKLHIGQGLNHSGIMGEGCSKS